MTKKQEPQLYDLSKHPAYARTVGQIFALWAMVEFRFCALFTTLLRSPPWLGQAAFYSIYNSKARADMTRALASRLSKTNPDRQRLLDLIGDIENGPVARHGYAHKPWLLHKGKVYQMDEIAPHLADAKKHHVSLTQLRADLRELKSLEKKVNDFVADYSARNPTQFYMSDEDVPWIERLSRRSPDPGQ